MSSIQQVQNGTLSNLQPKIGTLFEDAKSNSSQLTFNLLNKDKDVAAIVGRLKKLIGVNLHSLSDESQDKVKEKADHISAALVERSIKKKKMSLEDANKLRACYEIINSVKYDYARGAVDVYSISLRSWAENLYAGGYRD
ncbi:MAG: hypothetical protein V4691_01170 [Pseudomonadota bacterium]